MASKRIKRVKRILLVAFLAAVIAAGYLSYVLFSPNTPQDIDDNTFVYIPKKSTFSSVKDSLTENHLIQHPTLFTQVARWVKYDQHIKSGKYKLTPGMNTLSIVRLLRSGRQTPVNVVLGKVRTQSELAKLLSRYLEPDSSDYMQLFQNNNYLDSIGYTSETLLAAVIPNTYQYFWDTDAEKVFNRLVDERDKFWNSRRQAKADSLGLSPIEVYTLASIVEEETNKAADKGPITSVYLNRIKKGMTLGADPTVKFAVQNFALQRITHKETQFDSPYNTYLYKGLPPGPICTPSIETIDAVLNPPTTKYLYFCAKADFSGYHVFTSNYAEHLRNAQAFHRALNARNIH